MSIWSKLYGYQRSAVDWITVVEHAGLFGQQGIGKTWIAGGVLELLAEARDGELDALLVVPLANLESTWLKLFKEQLPQLNVTRTLEDFREAPQPRVLLLHYQALLTKQGKSTLGEKLIRMSWTFVSYDECQGLKDRGSKTSRLAGRFREVEYRLGLSGTPIEKTPIDLWAQFRFFAPDVFGKRWGDFEEEYTYPTGYMGRERKMIKRKLPHFMKAIDDSVLRIEKGDVLELPPLTYKRAPVSLYGTQRRMYEAMEKEMIAELGNSTTTAEFAVTKIIKLQQICSGFIKDDEGEIVFLGNAKMRKLLSLVERKDLPIVIFARFKEDISRIHKAFAELGHRVVKLWGDTPKRDRGTIIGGFQDGEIDILVCQIKTGGVGVDLYRSHVAIYYSTTWSFIDFDQSVARLHRNGQLHAVEAIIISARGTVDEDIHAALLRKEKVAFSVLSKLKKKRAQGGVQRLRRRKRKV